MKVTLLLAALLSSLSIYAQTTDASYPASEPNLEKVKPQKDVESMEEQQERMEEKKRDEADKEVKRDRNERESIENFLPASTPP